MQSTGQHDKRHATRNGLTGTGASELGHKHARSHNHLHACKGHGANVCRLHGAAEDRLVGQTGLQAPRLLLLLASHQGQNRHHLCRRPSRRVRAGRLESPARSLALTRERRKKLLEFPGLCWFNPSVAGPYVVRST
eukprot:scaffold45107_cov34-Tisochrysis_lutea.AAC.1